MPSLTVIVTASDDVKGLKYTLEGLVEQTTEDFKVVIIENCCEKESADMIDEYCAEYVGFEKLTTEQRLSVPAARNYAARLISCDYYWFIDCCDYISPESVECVLAAAEETRADVICPRYYVSGTNEPAYNEWADMLATVPDVDKFDRALLNSLDFDGRVFSRKAFDLGLSYPDTPVLYNTQFLSSLLYGVGVKVTGVAGAIYDKKNGIFYDDYAPGAEPGAATIELFTSVYGTIYSRIVELIMKETGAADGDEYTVQEFLTVWFGNLVSYFYRRFWYLSDEDIAVLRDKFEEISSRMTQDRKNKFNENNKDIRFPGMYMSRADAAKMPFFSLLLDFTTQENVTDFIRVLYIGDFPFFEIFLRESLRDLIPERLKGCENIHIVPDAGFFSEARKQCAGVPVNVKDTSPLDTRVLSQLSLSKAPRGMFQYLFSAKRKKYAAKTYLKNKGLSLQ